jgi:hypothetical protein
MADVMPTDVSGKPVAREVADREWLPSVLPPGFKVPDGDGTEDRLDPPKQQLLS